MASPVPAAPAPAINSWWIALPLYSAVFLVATFLPIRLYASSPSLFGATPTEMLLLFAALSAGVTALLLLVLAPFRGRIGRKAFLVATAVNLVAIAFASFEGSFSAVSAALIDVLVIAGICAFAYVVLRPSEQAMLGVTAICLLAMIVDVVVQVTSVRPVKESRETAAAAPEALAHAKRLRHPARCAARHEPRRDSEIERGHSQLSRRLHGLLRCRDGSPLDAVCASRAPCGT